MNKQSVTELADQLRRRRSLLLEDVAESQEEMKAIAEEQGSEFEEAVQRDRIKWLTSQLSDRDRQKIKEINAALERVSAGVYGQCEDCGNGIGIARLRALPTATLCITCAAAREARKRSTASERPSERLPVRNPNEALPGDEDQDQE